ncbi:MAG: hypothetical protein JXJ17_19600 [Anaerolineae bacterium]|nr:hypothetical protein [Anaerolineae bacterium]
MAEEKKKKKGGGCRSVLLFLLAVLLVILIPVTLLTFNIGRVVYSPRIVKNVASEVIVNSDLVPQGLEWFSEWRAHQRVEDGMARPNEDEPDVEQLLAFLTFDDWEAAREEILLDEYLIGWTHGMVDGVYTWIDNDEHLPDVVLPMKDFKARVKTKHGNNAIMIAYDALPECNATQLADFNSRLNAAPVGSEVLYNLCQFPQGPPNNWGEDQINDYNDSLQDVVQELPDEYRIVQRLEEDGAVVLEGVTAEQTKTILRIIRVVLRWSLLLPAIVAVILFLTSTGSEKMGLWMGATLVGGGALGLIMGITYKWTLTSIMVGIPLESVSAFIIKEAMLFLVGLAGHVFIPIIGMALVFIALGLVFLFAGKRREEEEEEEEELVDMEVVSTIPATMVSPAPEAPATARAAAPPPVTDHRKATARTMDVESIDATTAQHGIEGKDDEEIDDGSTQPMDAP